MNQFSATRPARWLQLANEGARLTITGLQLTLRRTAEESGGACAVIEVTVPPHFAGWSPHLHRQTSEFLYLMSGTLAFTLDQETVIARPGSFVHVTPGVLHRYWNPTAAPATYLAFLTPGGAEQYFVALADLLGAEPTGVPADPSQMTALGLQYDHFMA
jgi:quercetin dioxygenase-like cupin family protein